jgi:hypothetical protein
LAPQRTDGVTGGGSGEWLAQKVSGWIVTDNLRTDVCSRLAELENAVATYKKGFPVCQLQLNKLPVPIELMHSPQFSAMLETCIAVNHDSPRLLAVNVVTPARVDLLIVRIE